VRSVRLKEPVLIWPQFVATAKLIKTGGNPNQITFHVPGNAALVATFARFRFGMDAALPPTGGANDGEVEDNKIVIVAP